MEDTKKEDYIDKLIRLKYKIRELESIRIELNQMSNKNDLFKLSPREREILDVCNRDINDIFRNRASEKIAQLQDEYNERLNKIEIK